MKWLPHWFVFIGLFLQPIAHGAAPTVQVEKVSVSLAGASKIEVRSASGDDVDGATPEDNLGKGYLVAVSPGDKVLVEVEGPTTFTGKTLVADLTATKIT